MFHMKLGKFKKCFFLLNVVCCFCGWHFEPYVKHGAHGVVIALVCGTRVPRFNPCSG